MENLKSKLGQEPAFPMVNSEGLPGLITEPYSDFIKNYYTNGMSKRFYAACIVMQGILANSHISTGLLNKDGVVKASYQYADELLKQENE